MSSFSAPPPLSAELLLRRDHAPPLPSDVFEREHDDVNEALLLAETEELLNCLEPTAFALSSASAVASQSPSPALSSQQPVTPDACAPTETPVVRRRGRRSWKADATRNPSRERLQVELATLRQQASELGAELTIARAHREELKSSKLLLVPTWQRIAKRQLRARRKSEDENKRLQRMVESQRVFVTQLQYTWHQWRKMTALDPYSSLATMTVRFDVTDPAIFDVLAADLDLTYLRLEHVFRDAGLRRHDLDVSSSSTTKSRQLGSGKVAPFLEMTVVEAEPYDCSMLTQVVWEFMHLPGFQRNHILYGDVHMAERTTASKMRVMTVQHDRPVALEMLTATRRYVENGRTTFVWRNLTRADDGGGELSNAFIDETGWITMQSMASAGEPLAPSGTLTLTCVHLEPKSASQGMSLAGGHSIDQDPLMRLTADCFQTDFQRMNEMIEDRMLLGGGAV